MRGFLSWVVVAPSLLSTCAALHNVIRDSGQSQEECADLGCSNANSIGNDCFAAVGDINEFPDDWDVSPQNAKEVRDCICGSEYWSLLSQQQEPPTIRHTSRARSANHHFIEQLLLASSGTDKYQYPRWLEGSSNRG
ncbi:MAG: hypothetical protein Q9174_005341 [Haloplaca sp. 1 TL-2023]